MVLGTSSGAGKSWLTTALCRYYSNLGLKVAPFKAQNMSNNARVIPAPTLPAAHGALPPDGALAARDGSSLLDQAKSDTVFSYGEIGAAQYFQALAAGAQPDVRMNPLLLKPEADTHSQVVLLGKVSPELTRLPWRGRSALVWPQIAAALDSLRAENDVVVIEGAGSPAETNLAASDVVNMRVAEYAGANCLLVADIDRGGAFAHLYGTWALVPPSQRPLIKGFVLNKFRGDASLLAPAPQDLEVLTGVPTVGVIPMQYGHGLPEEDGVFDASPSGMGTAQTKIAIIAYPRISNLDEFQPLKNCAGVQLIWARSSADLQGADWVILPGSKATAADLAWLRGQKLDAAIAAHVAAGRQVLGICGGLQMLGEALIDPEQIDGNGPGLGLLPLVTAFAPAHEKTVRPFSGSFGVLQGAWAALSGVAVSAYEIHQGQTALHPAMAAAGCTAAQVLPDGLGWVSKSTKENSNENASGLVLGTYLHGLFEDPRVLQALFGQQARSLDSVFEGLAANLQVAVGDGVLQGLLGTGITSP
jgi:adenosylcobyric acid synthase